LATVQEDIADIAEAVRDYGITPVREPILEEELPGGRRKTEERVSWEERGPVIEVSSGNSASIRYFVDGIQRTRLIGTKYSLRYDVLVPVHLSIVGAIIIEHEAETYKPVVEPKIEVHVLVPSKKILDENFLKKCGHLVEETQKKGKPGWEILNLRRKAYIKSSDLRQKLEIELTEQLLKRKSFDDGLYLLIDGTIYPHNAVVRPDVIGLIKRHYESYLNPKDETQVFSMGLHKRSAIFSFKRRGGLLSRPAKIFSCYAKIRHEPADPLFGLIRLEFFEDTAKNVDLLCTAIFDLTDPLYMASREWDTKVYPIHICERYLDSELPSMNVIGAILGW